MLFQKVTGLKLHFWLVVWLSLDEACTHIEMELTKIKGSMCASNLSKQYQAKSPVEFI